MNPSAETQRIVFEFARAASIEGWWLWALLILSLATLIYGCVRFYNRDTDELSFPIRLTLASLRVVAIGALIFFFFDLQRRTQREFTRPSEVVVLVDTSTSMALAESNSVGSQSRIDRTVGLFADRDKLIDRFAGEHRLSIYGFGSQSDPVLLESHGDPDSIGADVDTDEASPRAESDGRVAPLAIAGAALVGIAILLSVASLIQGAITARQPTSLSTGLGWVLAATALCLILGIAFCGSSYSVNGDRSFLGLLGFPEGDAGDELEGSADENEETQEETIRVSDWSEAIAADAPQSRIGDAIASVLATHDPSTLAGIVVVTDGQNNGGNSIVAATASARRNGVAVYPVGLGSKDAPTNIRVVDLDAPRRVYPNDKFSISGVLQATGGKELEITVQLLDGLEQLTPEGVPSTDLPTDVVDSKTVKVPGDGTLSGIKFELEPASVGRRRLAIRVVPPEKDQNEKDNVRDARYEVVARKLRVLTIAGGPTREYRFVRNLFYREKSIRLDTWLQSGQPGMSQDADALLTEFPTNAAELFEYDAIVMFDPDWTLIPGESLELLDRWLASQAGGLVIVGGPVFHSRWLRLRTDPRVSQIASFYPVTFSTSGLVFNAGREGGQTAWVPEFTPESRRAEFLWVTDDPETSFQAWESFGGVYDYVGVKSAKPVAKVYSYFSDPTTEIGDSLPVYMASQFYGAGRVYFQGSGEMWRMRRESDAYFDSYYTKLVRWACEGRLLRDSNRGLLLVDNPRAMVGDTITIRAVLSDDQFEPLTVPEVIAKLLTPNGTIQDVRLTPIQGEVRPGTYSGRFVVRTDGNYEVRLSLDPLGEQLLRKNIQVRQPTIEMERPQRNDPALADLATTTGGEYLAVNQSVSDKQVGDQLVEWIRPQPQTTVLPGTPDPTFSQRRNASLLWLIASVLTMEWVVRRLHRLA